MLGLEDDAEWANRNAPRCKENADLATKKKFTQRVINFKNNVSSAQVN